MTNSQTRRGRRPSDEEMVLDLVVSRAGDPKPWLPSYKELEKEIERQHGNEIAPNAARRWSSQRELQLAVLAHIQNKRLIHRTNGRALQRLEDSLRARVPRETLIEQVASVAEEIFLDAYQGKITEASDPGSRHRLRWILLGHHVPTEVRRVLAAAIADDLQRYVDAVRAIFEAQGVRAKREPEEIVSDLVSMLDGYLMRAVVAIPPAPRGWSKRFARSASALVESAIDDEDGSSPPDLP